MKSIITAFALTVILVACSSPEPSDASDQKAAVKDTATTDTTATVDYQPINTDEALIATALMAAPAASREGCKVIGYNMEGEFVTLKEGDNEFICLADNPQQEGFNAACYHKSLEPFMARGRELRAEGKNAGEIFDMREEEVKTGKLTMGETGSTLHIYYGPEQNYDPATGKVAGANYRYVVYMPYATAASTGLPEEPVAPNHPWIMNPGTHRAHIMISPLKEN